MTKQFASILTVKALLMTHYQSLRTLAANVKLLLEMPVSSTTSAQFNDAQLDLMNAWNAEDDEELQDRLTMTQVPVGQKIRVLKAAPLTDKLIVLTSMPLINREYAAEFLGIPETVLSHFNAFHHDIFGSFYMGCRHYSLDELTLIESNQEWLSGHRKSLAPASSLIPGYPRFHRFTVVEEKVAMAFCNITRDELPEVAYVTRHKVTTYYLTDLEKIRVGKLKAHQQ